MYAQQKINVTDKASGIFLREWIKKPLEVAAIAPSSRSLGRLITKEISDKTGPVLELGPGTGVFTQELLNRGVSPNQLVLIEKNAAFADILKMRFPHVHIVAGDASCYSKESLNFNEIFGATISGMGVLSMPREVVKNILQHAFDHMVEGGAFYQFTYAWRCPIPQSLLQELGLKAVKIGHTLRNAPPASVYKITKKA